MGEQIVHTSKARGSRPETVMGVSVPCFLVLIWLVVGTCIGGCASEDSFISSGGNLFVKIIPSSQVRVSNISTNQEAEELVITGKVSRRNAAFSGRGHVDVAVVSPAGAVICMASANYTPTILPKTPGARNHHPSHFEVHLHCTPPEGSVIRVAYHGKPGPDDPRLGCGDNAALPDDHEEKH